MAFYAREGSDYRSGELTRGPWDPDSQHAGPPCALLGRELDAAGEIESARLVRASFEILRPVPMSLLSVEAQVVRGGRSVELIDGVLRAEGRDIVRARAWRIRTTELEIPPEVASPALPGPEDASPEPFFETGSDVGYHTAMEVRFLHGSYQEPGPAAAWMRMRVALVEGEEPTPLARVLTAADSGNGVSSPLDYRRHLFINTDLTVSLAREPEGEWVALDARSRTSPDGTGLTDTTLHDTAGYIGRATQSLLVGHR